MGPSKFVVDSGLPEFLFAEVNVNSAGHLGKRSSQSSCLDSCSKPRVLVVRSNRGRNVSGFPDHSRGHPHPPIKTRGGNVDHRASGKQYRVLSVDLVLPEKQGLSPDTFLVSRKIGIVMKWSNLNPLIQAH